MNRDDVSWTGYWPAAPTPFAVSGEVDFGAIKALMDLYATQRVDGVLINGSTGEWFSQTDQERRDVAAAAVAAVSGRYPVIVGVTAYTAAEAAGLARHARSVGADGVLATVPPYVHPADDEIVEFYRTVSQATELPFMVYNWPRGVAVDMSGRASLLGSLADLPNVVAVKDSTGDWLGMLATVELLVERVRVFGSFLHRRGVAVLLEIGGDGNIDGGGVGAPFGVPFYRAVADGNAAAARTWAEAYQRLSGRFIRPDYSGVFASPVSQLKAVMELLGQPGGSVRPPLLPVTDAQVWAAIRAAVDESGVREALATPGAVS